MILQQTPIPFDNPAEHATLAQDETISSADANGFTGPMTDIADLVLDLSFLDEGGFLWRIRTQGFGLLAATLDWKSVGVRVPDDSAVHLRPGQTDLLPQRYVRAFRSLRDRLGAMLRERGYTPPVIEAAYHGGWTWLPRQHHLAWDEEYAAVQAGLAAEVGRVAEEYPLILAQMRTYFQTLAARAVISLQANGVAIPDPERLRTEIVTGSLRKVPTPAQLATISIRRIPKSCRLRSDIEREIAATQHARVASAAAEAAVRLQRMHDEEAARRERLETAAVAARLQRERDAEEAYRHMEQQALQEALATRVTQAVSVVDDVLAEMHQKLHTALVGTQESIRRHGTLNAKASRDLNRFLALYEKINIFERTHPGVRDLDAAIAELRQAVRCKTARRQKPSRAHDLGALQAAVDHVVALTLEQARAGVGRPSRLGALEL